MTISSQLKALGIPDDLIASAKVGGKPIALAENKATAAVGRMNKTEARYAAGLDYSIRSGAVRAYWFGSVTLRLAHKTRYTPDFLVWHIDGSLQFVEIKGFLRDDASIKYKLAREQYPWATFTMLRWVRGRWEQVNI